MSEWFVVLGQRYINKLENVGWAWDANTVKFPGIVALSCVSTIRRCADTLKKYKKKSSISWDKCSSMFSWNNRCRPNTIYTDNNNKSQISRDKRNSYFFDGIAA